MLRKLILWSFSILVIAVVLSVSLISDSDQALESKKEDFGFKVLSVGENPNVDIVAIHGLDGHREKSWTSKNGTMWLKDLLPEDIPTARILTYGFDADTRSFTQTSTNNIFRHAEGFVVGLSEMRRENQERPIIFLAHSLGGIILKKALASCHAASFKYKPQHRAIKVSTHAVLFFGTPHSGANGVELAQWLGRLSSVYMYTSRTVLKDLNRDSFELESIQQSYVHASEDIKTIFFYEEYRTTIIDWWFSEMIVPRHLATIQGERNADVVALHADHIQMVKFGGRIDSDYGRVAGYLVDLVKDAATRVEQNWNQEEGLRTVKEGGPQNTALPKLRPSVSRNYVERPRIQNLLSTHLLPLGPPKQQPRCVLRGLAGSGKTQLATFWIEKNRDRFRRIIYIDAVSQYQIEADLETAIKSVGRQYSKATWKDAVAYLSTATQWMLFFDNADTQDLRLDEYLPRSPHGIVLVTTRNKEFTNYAPECHIIVGDLSEGEALDILHGVANIHPSSQNASIAIVKELGLLALAVTQAGAYIFNNTPDFDMYLRLLRKHRDELMRNAFPKGRDYNWSTYAAFEMSFNQLPPKSRKFMSICAFFHHSLIPRALFEKSTASKFRSHFIIAGYPPPDDYETILSDLEDIFGSEWVEYEFQKLIGPIIQHSLMDFPIDDHKHSFYNIHPLVQTFIQDLHAGAEKDRYALQAGQLLAGAILFINRGENNDWHRQLSPHIDSLLVRVGQPHVYHSQAFTEVYDSVGNWNASQLLYEYIYVQFAEVFGLRHPDTIRVMSDLASTLLGRGQLEEAERMQREVLVLQEEVLGLRHPDTISGMHKLASTLRASGQLEEAERMQREVLVLQEEVLGLRHPDRILVMSNLALTLLDRGQLEEADRMQREVLVLWGEVLGLRHPNTIVATHHLALTLLGRGQLEEADRMQREVLVLWGEVLGLRHPDTIMAMHNLASTLHASGQLEEAERMQREVLVLRREVLGLRHPDTIMVMNNLALTLLYRGQLEEADRMQREVLVLWGEVFGLRHPNTITAMNNLASTLHASGQLEEAERMQREALVLRREVLGLRHPDTIMAMHNVASILLDRGQLEEVERMLREILVLREEVLGLRHPETIMVMNNLALTLLYRGQLEEADRMQREVLVLWGEVLGLRHPNTIMAMNNLASTLRASGQLEEADATSVE